MSILHAAPPTTTTSTSTVNTQKPKTIYAQAISSYGGNAEQRVLGFSVGARFIVQSTDGEWWPVQMCDRDGLPIGREGFVPSNYVTIIDESELSSQSVVVPPQTPSASSTAATTAPTTAPTTQGNTTSQPDNILTAALPPPVPITTTAATPAAVVPPAVPVVSNQPPQNTHRPAPPPPPVRAKVQDVGSSTATAATTPPVLPPPAPITATTTQTTQTTPQTPQTQTNPPNNVTNLKIATDIIDQDRKDGDNDEDEDEDDEGEFLWIIAKYDWAPTDQNGEFIKLQKGRRYKVFGPTNEQWWFAQDPAFPDDGGYVPSNYCLLENDL
jgi:hypothetical protein